jgi:hypothetical protein
MPVAKNIYHAPKKLFHQYQVRIQRNGKQVFYRGCDTLEAAVKARDTWLKDQLAAALGEDSRRVVDVGEVQLPVVRG